MIKSGDRKRMFLREEARETVKGRKEKEGKWTSTNEGNAKK